jgi:hypothetical protein
MKVDGNISIHLRRGLITNLRTALPQAQYETSFAFCLRKGKLCNQGDLKIASGATTNVVPPTLMTNNCYC